jgi:hypothetical protein
VSGRPPPQTAFVAAVLAALAMLIAAPGARGNFVYWTSGDPNSSVARAKINGTGLKADFIAGLDHPQGVAVDSRYVYWTQGDASTGSIGRANLDGSAPDPNFIPHSDGVTTPTGIAVTPTAIYWQNGGSSIGRANVDGTAPNPSLIPTTNSTCGLTADSTFLYFLDDGGAQIGRATFDGGSVTPDFASIPGAFCGLAVDVNYLYWASDSGNTVGVVPVTGGPPVPDFIPAGTTSGGPSGVAVNPQFVFWGNYDTGAVGRAGVNGGAVNPALIPNAGVTGPVDLSQLVAAPNNKINLIGVAGSKKKGTAMIVGGVPSPGVVSLDETAGPDVQASAAAISPASVDLPRAETFGLVVRPVGKMAKRLNRQVSKKGKGRVRLTVFIHFVPAGVAGVENSLPVDVTLTMKGTKRKTKKHSNRGGPSGPANRRILGE